MRAFIVLAFVALAQADVGGYNYGAGSTGVIGDDGGISGGSLSGGSLSGGSLGGVSYGGGSLSVSSLGGGSFSGGSLGGGSLSGGSLGGGSVGGGSFSSGSLGGGSLSGGSLGGGSVGGGSFSSGSLGGNSLGGGSLGSGSLGGGAIDGGSLSGGSVGDGSLSSGAGPATVEYTKEFYSFNAPEAEFESGKHLGDLAQSLKKNLRVIFIRAPEGNGLSQAALNLAKSAVDSRTAIYVLTKQGDISDLANKLQSLNSHNVNKPEVHFVKYRTPEDAAHAQHAIQQQYSTLPGVSENHDGGVAPVLDFASKAPAPASARPIEGLAGGYLAPASGGSVGSVGSIGSDGSVGSFGGVGSVSSFGNSGSIGSGGSVGSFGSGGSIGSVGTPSTAYLPIVKY